MIRFGGIEICSVTKTIRNGSLVMDCTANKGSRGGPAATARFKAFKWLLCADGNGLSRAALFDLVYGDDPNGGPECGLNVFDVSFCQSWGTAMRQLEVALKKEKRAGQVYMRMVPVAHVV